MIDFRRDIDGVLVLLKDNERIVREAYVKYGANLEERLRATTKALTQNQESNRRNDVEQIIAKLKVEFNS